MQCEQLSGELVDDDQHAKTQVIRRHVMHKVHRIALSRGRRAWKFSRFGAGYRTPTGFTYPFQSKVAVKTQKASPTESAQLQAEFSSQSTISPGRMYQRAVLHRLASRGNRIRHGPIPHRSKAPAAHVADFALTQLLVRCAEFTDRLSLHSQFYRFPRRSNASF
jgi:hypothetical protein